MNSKRFLPKLPHLIQLFFFGILIFFGSSSVFAEGSRSLYPNTYNSQGSRADLDLQQTYYYLGIIHRITFIYVYANQGEYILLGSSNISAGGDILVYNPQNFGTTANESIVNSAANFSCATNSAGVKGSITNRTAELAGPGSADGTKAGGYTPCAYKAPTTGIYGVVFTEASTGPNLPNGSIANISTSTVSVAAWDVTIRNSASSTNDINARVFTYAWNGYTGANGRPLYSTLYYTTKDGYRYSQYLQGMDPSGFTLYANNQGFLDNGQPLYKDLRGDSFSITYYPNPPGLNYLPAGIVPQTPQFPVFFNDISPAGVNSNQVDTVLTALGIPNTPPTPIVSIVNFTGSLGNAQTTLGAGANIQFTTTNTITYQIVISANGTNFDPSLPTNRVLTGIAQTGTHSVNWDGKDNSGNVFPLGSYSFQLEGQNGNIHLPIIDDEGNQGGGPIVTRLNGANTPNTTAYFDDRGYITKSGTVIGTPNGFLCGNPTPTPPNPDYNLQGVDSTTPYRYWPGNGNANQDCNSSAGFGDAKALDLWSYYSTAPITSNFKITASVVDLATQITAPNYAAAGSNVNGTFSFANNGNSSADHVIYSYTVAGVSADGKTPIAINGLTIGNLPTGGSYTYAGGVLTLSLPNTLAASASISGITYSYTAPTSGTVTVTSKINTTDIPNPDTFQSNNTASAITACGFLDVSTTVGVTPTSTDVGTTINGTVSFTNNSNQPVQIPDPKSTTGGTIPNPNYYANNVSYSLQIGNSANYPATVSVIGLPSTGYSYDPTTGVVIFPGLPTSLPAGTNYSLNFSFVAGKGTIPVISTISTTSADSNLSNNTASVTVNALFSDMGISLTGFPADASPNSQYTGTLTCLNNGTEAALSPICGLSTSVGKVSNCKVGTGIWSTGTPVPVGSSIVCTVTATTSANGTLNISANTGASNDHNLNNNQTTASLTIPVIAAYDTPTINETFSGGSINVLTQPSTPDTLGSSDVIVGNNISEPSFVNIITPTGTVTPTGTTNSLDGFSFDTNGNLIVPVNTPTGTYTVDYQICTLNNPNACNTAKVNINVQGSGMSPSLSGFPTTPTISGNPVSGTLTCTNNGPAPAENPTCTSSFGTTSCSPTTFPASGLPAGSSISCTVNGTAPNNGPLEITGTTGAANSPTTSTQTSVPIEPVTTLTPGLNFPSSVNGGSAVSGTLTCTNTGSAPAVNATCTVGTTNLSNVKYSCSPTPPVGSLAAGASINCTISGTAPANGSVTVTGTTAADNAPSNNASTPITVNPVTTLAPVLNFPSSVNGGALVTGTLTCSNNGSSPALNATCTAGDTNLSNFTSSCTPTPPVSNLAAGASIVCSISGTAPANGSVTVTGTTAADNAPSNNATTPITVNPVTTLAPVLSFPSSVNGGALVTGTLTCSNNGSSPALNATCTPGDTNLSNFKSSCTPTPPVSNLAAGASIVCTISGTAPANGSVTVTGTTAADNAPSNNATTPITVNPVTTLAPVLKFPSSVNGGATVTGTLTCSNNGSFPALNATCSAGDTNLSNFKSSCTPTPPVSNLAAGASIVCSISGTAPANGSVTVTGTTAADNAPSNNATTPITVNPVTTLAPVLSFPSSVNGGALVTGTLTCSNNGSSPALNATCSAGDTNLSNFKSSCTPTPPVSNLAAGASIVCTISGTAPTSGSVTVTGTTAADNAPSNNASTPITVNPVTTLAPVLNFPSSVNGGATVTGTLTCSNNGSFPALNATCSAGDTNLSNFKSSCTPTPPVSNLAAGASIVCTISGTAPTSGSVTVTGTTAADNAPSNNATTPITVNPVTTLAPVLNFPSSVNGGATVTGTLTCSNSGSSPALNATCTPGNTNLSNFKSSCTPTPPVSNLAAGASIICNISGTAPTSGSINITGTSGATNATSNTVNAPISVQTNTTLTPVLNFPSSAYSGAPVTGTLVCTNTGANVAANASCTATNTNLGNFTSSCSPTPPVSSLAVGASITCSITGTAPTSGTITINGTSSATNAPSGNTNTTIPVNTNNSLNVSLSGFPAAVASGATNVQGTVICSNATGVATLQAATCAASYTTTGSATSAPLTISACQLLPAGTAITLPVNLPTGSSISCTATLPTAPASGNINVTGSTSATNDNNGNALSSPTTTIPVLYTVNNGTIDLPDSSSPILLTVLSGDNLGGSNVAVGSNIATPTITSGSTDFTFNTSGQLVVPANEPAGTYPLTYQVCTATTPPVCDSATITVVINPAPAAENDAANTLPNTPVNVIVTANDSAAEGATLDLKSVNLNPGTTLTSGTPSSKTIFGEGTFTAPNDGSGEVTFTPVAGFVGEVTVPYTDSTLPYQNGSVQTSNTANITITVLSSGKIVANNDYATTNASTPVTIPVLANDVVSGTGVTINTSSVLFNPGGSIKPTANYTVANVGTWSVVTNGEVKFTPVANFSGVASIPYTVDDSANPADVSNTAQITVVVNSTPPNSGSTPISGVKPIANNDTGTTQPDTAVSLPILNNDLASNGFTLLPSTVILDPGKTDAGTSVNPPEGIWSVDSSGTLTFTPAAIYIDPVTQNPGPFTGTASVTYSVDDNGTGGASNIATVTVTVNATGLTANPDSASSEPGIPVTLSPASNDVAETGAIINPSTVNIATGPIANGTSPFSTSAINTSTTISGQGTWTVTDNKGTVVFTPLATFTGTATLQYQVEDSFGNTGTATMTVTVNPFAPTNLSYTTPQNQPLIINVPVKEASNVPVGTTFTVASNPLHGTLTINNDGTYTYDYTPSTQSYTADSFTYKACLPGPNQSVCSTKTVSITLSTTGGNLISQPSLTLSASTLNTACYRPVELYVSGGGGTGAVGISATSPNGAVCQIYQSGGNWFLRIASANGSCQVTATKAGSTVGSNTYSPLTTETPANNVITVSIN